MSTNLPETLPSLQQSPTTASIAGEIPASEPVVGVPEITLTQAPATLQPATGTSVVVQPKEWYQSKTVVVNATIAILTGLLGALEVFANHDYSFTGPVITICLINFLNILLRFATSRPISN